MSEAPAAPATSPLLLTEWGSEPFCYRVTRVRQIDGDSAEIDADLGTRIALRRQVTRLPSLDAPERTKGSPTVRRAGEAALWMAATWTEAMARAAGGKLWFVSREWDLYGRLLGEFSVVPDPRQRLIDYGVQTPEGLGVIALVENGVCHRGVVEGWLRACSKSGKRPTWTDAQAQRVIDLAIGKGWGG